jgi:hypothetical protein
LLCVQQEIFIFYVRFYNQGKNTLSLIKRTKNKFEACFALQSTRKNFTLSRFYYSNNCDRNKIEKAITFDISIYLNFIIIK